MTESNRRNHSPSVACCRNTYPCCSREYTNEMNDTPLTGLQLYSQRLKERNLASYIANPNVCAYCRNPILPKPGEALHAVRIRKFCNRKCSFECSHAAGKMGRKAPRKLRICASCDSALTTYATKFCTSCWKAKCVATHMRTKGDSSHREIRNHAVYVAKHRPRVCISCGYNKFAETAHIRPVADFPATATFAEINHPTNLVMLCPNCHWEFDHQMMSLLTTKSAAGPDAESEQLLILPGAPST